MREQGVVTEITKSGARVRLLQTTACKTCAACNVCRPDGADRVLEVSNELNAQIHDEVVVEIPPGIGLTAFFLLFGVPIIFALAGVLIGGQYSEITSIILGIIGLALGLGIAKVFNNLLSRNKKFVPEIVEITNRTGS